MQEKRPQIFVTQSSLPPMEEYIREIAPLWENHWITNMGDKHKQLEAALQAYLGGPPVTLFSNGHLALELVLQAFELSGEVITTPFTFVSTTHAILRNGLTPVFCDIDPGTYTLDPARLEGLITEKTTAILPVHVYGNVCDVQAIEKLAQKHGLKVIYDAAHSFGVTVNGESSASFGDASMFSFHATKVFHTIEGGAVACRDAEITRRIKLLKNFGITGEESIEWVGANAKMNEFCAAMGICNLRHVEDEIAQRGLVVQRYLANLAQVDGLTLPTTPAGVKPNYAYFPVLFDQERFGQSRDAVYNKLKAAGIHCRKYFHPLTNSLSCFSTATGPETTPVARRVSGQVLTLPLYARLPLDEVDRICRLILER